MWKILSGALVIGSVTYGMMRYFQGAVCHCNGRLDGLIVIVTGATSGIGKALALELAKRGAILILGCRDIQRAKSVKREILKAVDDPIPEIHIYSLDLNSFESIRLFSVSVNANFRDKEIYAVVNNAGVFHHPQTTTRDGFDVTYQTNYLGPFLLSHFLLPKLRKSAHARIVNVASDAHRIATVYDLNCVTHEQTEFRTHYVAYAVSKLALVLFTREFARKLAKTNILVNAVDPGNVETRIFRYFPQLSNIWLYVLQWPIRRVVVKRPHQGIQSVVHALVTDNRSTGQYILECKQTLPSPVACNNQLAESYYALTLGLLGQFINESEC